MAKKNKTQIERRLSLLVGPVTGAVSQNVVNTSCPAGMKQQVSETGAVLWHDKGESTGQLLEAAKT